jgi:4a-hydroxytetrahydrobiopterin dehydratase
MEAPQGWSLEEDGAALCRSLRFNDFAEAFAFLTRLALHAEKVDHHPEFRCSWNRVELRLTSDDAGTATQRDVELAEAINLLLKPRG